MGIEGDDSHLFDTFELQPLELFKSKRRRVSHDVEDIAVWIGFAYLCKQFFRLCDERGSAAEFCVVFPGFFPAFTDDRRGDVCAQHVAFDGDDISVVEHIGEKNFDLIEIAGCTHIEKDDRFLHMIPYTTH